MLFRSSSHIRARKYHFATSHKYNSPFDRFSISHFFTFSDLAYLSNRRSANSNQRLFSMWCLNNLASSQSHTAILTRSQNTSLQVMPVRSQLLGWFPNCSSRRLLASITLNRRVHFLPKPRRLPQPATVLVLFNRHFQLRSPKRLHRHSLRLLPLKLHPLRRLPMHQVPLSIPKPPHPLLSPTSQSCRPRPPRPQCRHERPQTQKPLQCLSQNLRQLSPINGANIRL